MGFIDNIAATVLDRFHDRMDDLTIVFPNRRAGLFFRKCLAGKLNNPVWSPRILSIVDFITGLSPLKTDDKLEMVFRLHQFFGKYLNSGEAFDRFYYWGNILLQDFDELDKFLIDPELLFYNLSNIKKIDQMAGYLTDDQIRLIKTFWSNFVEKPSKQKEDFIAVWDVLLNVYKDFKISLKEQGIAYEGLIYREVSEAIENKTLINPYKKVLFAGFNALSPSEEKILTWYVNEHSAEIFWDADDHYLEDESQEAGAFFRKIRQENQVLAGHFKPSYGNAFKNTGDKQIFISNASSDTGQIQLAADIISRDLKQDHHKVNSEHTAIILPDQKLMFPLINALPPEVTGLNITMGYPISASLSYSYLDVLLDLQQKKTGKRHVFNHRPVLELLKHPFMVQLLKEKSQELVNTITDSNKIYIEFDFLIQDDEEGILRMVFKKSDDILSTITYLLENITFIAARQEEALEKEFLYQFYLVLNRLYNFFERHKTSMEPEAFIKLFRQIVNSQTLPFEGEPLEGMQIMGLLETRNLDFEHVIMLSVNEDLVPPTAKVISFIPYSIRKAFSMPTFEYQDSIYAYLFYRLIQGSNHIDIIYNASEEYGRSGEISRYIRQLETETDIPVIHRKTGSEVTFPRSAPVSICKNPEIIARLERYTSKKNFQKRFTPTAINMWLDCRLKFYFRYVMDLYEYLEIQEEIDPMAFGNILHQVMEHLYMPYNTDGNRELKKQDIEKIKETINPTIEKIFALHFGTRKDMSFEFSGQNILVREIIRKVANEILKFDMQRVPFSILGLEMDEKKGCRMNLPVKAEQEHFDVGLKGILDRVDQKENVIRIVDYKTGKDKKVFTDIESLFNREDKNREKAVFQTFFYASIFDHSLKKSNNAIIQTSLFNIREMFDADFQPLIQLKIEKNTQPVENIMPYIDEYNKHLKSTIEEIYKKDITFTQTDVVEKCRYCPYSGICNR